MQIKRKSCLALCLLCALMLAGCGKTGKLNEGNCKLSIAFVDIPKELSMLEENVQGNLEIRLTLKNISSEKLYHIKLDPKNSYATEVSLHPGVYQVYTLSNSQYSNTGLKLSADLENVELKEDSPARLHIYVDNAEEFTKHWMSVQPMPEMLLAEKFDGLIQVNRQIYDLHSESSSGLISQFDLEYDNQVRPYQKVELKDSDKGVTLILQNQTSEPLDWHSCKVVGIDVSKNNVVFPQGVTLGMAPAAVCHEADGLYGAPDALSGSLLLGWSFDRTYAVYNDPKSGDKLTIDLGVDNSQIRGIRYELALFD